MLSILTLFLIFIWFDDIQIRTVAGVCSLNGSVYQAGETWRPQLIGVMSCVNCTCLPNGSVHCVNEECPVPNCHHPKSFPGQCCPVCEVKTEENGADSASIKPCTHHGTVYQDGESFTSDKTGIKPRQDNQCVLCHCTNGEYFCHLKTCSFPRGCTQFIKTDGDCCLRCADANTEVKADGHDGLVPANDCQDANEIRKNGSSWHPVVESFGRQDCVVCECLNGIINCDRVKCRSADRLPCPDPVRAEGQCCKTCPASGRRKKNKSGKDGKNCRKGRKGKKRKCDAKDDAPKLSMDDVMYPSPRSVRTGGSGLRDVCMPNRTDILIYRSNHNGTLFLAFEDISARTVKELCWNVKKRKLFNYQVKNVPSVEFRKTVDKKHILAASSKRNYKKFMRRLERKLKSCKRRCRVKAIISVFLRLRMRNVKFRIECRKHNVNGK